MPLDGILIFVFVGSSNFFNDHENLLWLREKIVWGRESVCAREMNYIGPFCCLRT